MPGSTATRRIAVIIPFFQREAGILASAVRSVAAQIFRWPVAVDLIIVDDASPITPGDELAALSLPRWLTPRIVAQSNAGPGAARNRGLDHVGPDIAYVAFLDSDDSWSPGHLQQGIDALDLGHDFYFCDSAMPPSTLFASRELFTRGDDQHAVEVLPAVPHLHRFRPGRAGTAMVEEYLCQTSTVILRSQAVRALRFDERLRFAGEDWLMWVQLAHGVEAVCFSTMANAHRGEGINLYRDAHDRLQARNLRRLLSMILANRLMAKTPGIDRSSSALIDARIAMIQREIAAILLHPRLYRTFFDQDARRSILQAYRLMNLQLLPLWGTILAGKMLRPRPKLGEAAT